MNATLCPECDKLEHLGHKTLKVSALCLDNKFLAPSNSDRRLSDLKRLRELLETERSHCLTVTELAHFAELMAAFLPKLEGFIQDSEVSWDKQLSRCIEDHFLLKKTSLEAARKSFAECLAKVNLNRQGQYEQKTLNPFYWELR